MFPHINKEFIKSLLFPSGTTLTVLSQSFNYFILTIWNLLI
ncbi:hypothetical protein T10_10351 [Trichinella papuae]|uniref:Uncharacterized protein n=1 Tax=Trichinella papuae TaxID=268474 RepID=A0A0V1LYK0_9BILA|nr:hypothetical protein T10_10351 [Trichinella papuae]